MNTILQYIYTYLVLNSLVMILIHYLKKILIMNGEY